ncbi:hypothetical protein JEQ12_019846 [Ovis aries]|uniref:Transmembrane protein 126A n=1 Tax=Ovis aries TaxID=9940 RepID=A0A835ZGX8_SHEEP|nr:hypothetical protein JEQ12_019846 [Ovis aries]
MENHEPDGTIKENLIDIVARKINQLPEAERNLLFLYILHVTQAAGLPMAVIPFLTANISYKGFVSLPLNTGIIQPWLPEKGNILNYWIRTSKPVFRKMLFPILLQTGFAAYLGSRQYKLLIKALQLPRS